MGISTEELGDFIAGLETKYHNALEQARAERPGDTPALAGERIHKITGDAFWATKIAMATALKSGDVTLPDAMSIPHLAQIAAEICFIAQEGQKGSSYTLDTMDPRLAIKKHTYSDTELVGKIFSKQSLDVGAACKQWVGVALPKAVQEYERQGYRDTEETATIHDHMSAVLHELAQSKAPNAWSSWMTSKRTKNRAVSSLLS